MHDILIIGHGEMGQAFEFLLGKDNVDVWERHTATQPLEAVSGNRRFIFFCIPANPVNKIAESIREHIDKDTICLSIAKGLDDSGRPAAMAMRDALGDRCAQGVIYGPMISEELRAGRPGFGNLAVSDPDAVQKILSRFENSELHLYPNADLTGMTWCAILKNVYAMAFGMADELKLGTNVRGYLSVTALQELSRLSVHFGGQPETPYSFAGLGDLITTATSEDSHHHSLGRMMARGERDNLAGEGTHTLAKAREEKLIPIDEYPLFAAVNRVVLGEIDAETALRDLISSS
jgi:glycerol-3-phosphate dehydrogenase (NAD(P)+)